MGHLFNKKEAISKGFDYEYFCESLKNQNAATLLHMPPLRFHCVGGRWEVGLNQDCCDFGTVSQTL
jgi:hypothetical protein